MGDQKDKGDQLIKEAEQKLKSSQGFMSRFLGSNSKTEDAAELYVRAGNSFKMAKEWRAAGDAYCSAAGLQIRLQSKHEAATHYIDAANAYKKSDPTEAVTCYLNAIEIYTDMGRFTIAAKHHVAIAELYENEVLDLEKAITHYEKATDYFKGEESNSSANKCMLKCAQYAAQLEQYQKAIHLYEEVAAACIDNTLLKYSVKEYFFRACLCYMCMDLVEAQNIVHKYEGMFPAFTDARECKLVKTLLQACEDENVEAFTNAIQEYDSISRLEPWFTTMLLRIKKTINEEGDLR